MALWEELYIWSQTPALMHFVLIVFSWTVFVIHSSQGQTNDQICLQLPCNPVLSDAQKLHYKLSNKSQAQTNHLLYLIHTHQVPLS